MLTSRGLGDATGLWSSVASDRDIVVAGLLRTVTELHGSEARLDDARRALRAGAPGYQLGVLVDTPAHYRGGDPHERYVQRPGVLASAGWTTTLVLAKDVREDPQAVLRRLETALRAP